MRVILFIQKFIKRASQSLESIIRILLLSKLKVNSPDKSPSKECVILANGPSLLEELEKKIEFLNGKDTICVNHFPASNLYQKIKPTHFITAVPELWLSDVDEKYKRQKENLIQAFLKRTDWDINIFLPFESKQDKDWETSLRNNSFLHLFHFNNVPVEGFNSFENWCFSKNLGMPRPHNVLIPALITAINLGYEKIYLFGVDHSWLPEISVSKSNEVLINQKHFYDENTTKSEAMDIKGKGKRTLGQVLEKFMLAFNGYYTIDKYAKSKGVLILNCTTRSFIDAFERVEI